jgi:hypothetical protein
MHAYSIQYDHTVPGTYALYSTAYCTYSTVPALAVKKKIHTVLYKEIFKANIAKKKKRYA